MMYINKVIIRDSECPSSRDEFSEDFAGYSIASSVDYYDYYQIILDRNSGDLTAFLIALDPVRSTRPPQRWTNSVAVFQRVMAKVHHYQTPHEE